MVWGHPVKGLCNVVAFTTAAFVFEKVLSISSIHSKTRFLPVKAWLRGAISRAPKGIKQK